MSKKFISPTKNTLQESENINYITKNSNSLNRELDLLIVENERLNKLISKKFEDNHKLIVLETEYQILKEKYIEKSESESNYFNQIQKIQNEFQKINNSYKKIENEKYEFNKFKENLIEENDNLKKKLEKFK